MKRILLGTVSILGAMKEIIVADLREDPVELAPWLTSGVYLIAMLYFGVSGWKALVISSIILMSCWGNYGRRTLIRGGIVVLFFSLAVWAEVIPEPASWGRLVHLVIAEMK